MAAGMWQGLLAGYQDVEEKRLAREAKEEEILKRRRTVANALRPNIQENLQRVEEQRSMLTYLQGRGVPTETINALSEDPETLQGAFEFAREGQGADLTAEQLADIYRVTPLGDVVPGDAFTRLQSAAEVYQSFDSAEDPEAFMEMLPTGPARTSVVEVRMPEAPEEQGVSSMQDRTWGLQAQTYDRAVLSLARVEREALLQKQDRQEATGDDINKLTQLTEDINTYGSNEGQANTERLKGAYGNTAIELIESSPSMSPDLLVGFENNPLIFDLGEAARQSVIDNLGPELRGGVLVGEGVDPSDGRFTQFYTMPDGTTETVKE